MKSVSPKFATVRAGFSLLEVLMVVAVMSTIVAGAVFTVGNVTKAAENTKLQRDVTVINSAIRTYLLSGGTFLSADVSDPAAVLAKLKKRAGSQNAREIAGLRGSMADERLTYEMQSSAEAQDGVERARFIADPANPRFEIQRSGPPGIRRFVLDARLAAMDYGTEDRATTLALAKRDPWVWDYTDQGTSRDFPSLPPPRNATVANLEPPDAGNIVLNPPDFSIPTEAAPLILYPRSLALRPTNMEGTAVILYSINGSPFLPYAGPFDVDAGMTVTGISVSLNLDRYDDSPSSSRTYSTAPVTPWPFMIFTRAGYNYFELGGEAAPGTPPPLPTGSVNGTGLILNIVLIPANYQNSTVFRYVWTTDGTDPLTSGTAVRQGDFSGGFTGTAIPLPLDAFGTASRATVRSAVKAEDRAIVNDSAVLSRTLNAVPLALRAPRITLDGRDVTLVLDVAARDVPKDARIYYTTNGTDPGNDGAGNPRTGTLYSGVPFTLAGATGTNATVRARVYPPLRYRQFFNVSPPDSVTLSLPAPTDVYVGGNFVNPSGNLMRNIARLGNSGQVDLRFDTGTGASSGSLVGVVRQTTAGVMAGGDFDSLNGTLRPAVVRLNANGAVDTSFNASLTND